MLPGHLDFWEVSVHISCHFLLGSLFVLLLRNALYILGANCWQCVFTCFLSWGCSFVEQGGFPDVSYRRQEVVGLHAGGKLWRLWPSLSECHGPSPVLCVRQGFLES